MYLMKTTSYPVNGNNGRSETTSNNKHGWESNSTASFGMEVGSKRVTALVWKWFSYRGSDVWQSTVMWNKYKMSGSKHQTNNFSISSRRGSNRITPYTIIVKMITAEIQDRKYDLFPTSTRQLLFSEKLDRILTEKNVFQIHTLLIFY